LVFVEITLNRGAPDVFEQFNTAVQKLDDIQECHLVSGDFDYLLKTRVSDMGAYRKLLGDTLLRLPGVNDTRTYVVMEEVKQTMVKSSNKPSGFCRSDCFHLSNMSIVLLTLAIIIIFKLVYVQREQK
jgi:DNA-binding Lrp family transcriptional regulator